MTIFAQQKVHYNVKPVLLLTQQQPKSTHVVNVSPKEQAGTTIPHTKPNSATKIRRTVKLVQNSAGSVVITIIVPFLICTLDTKLHILSPPPIPNMHYTKIRKEHSNRISLCNN